jgi:hypothetical protein
MVAMQIEITTAEAAEVFSITKKTVCEYAKLGIFEKVAHGRYNLKESLVNYLEYQKCIQEGCADPWFVFTLRRDERWREEERADPELAKARFERMESRLQDEELTPMQSFEVEVDGEGKIVRVVGEAKG